MRAVVTKNRRQLKAGKDTTLPRTLNHAREHHLMPLIKTGEATFAGQVGLIIRTIDRVEIGRRVDGLTERVIPHESEVVTESFLNLQNGALVDTAALRAILIALHQPQTAKPRR